MPPKESERAYARERVGAPPQRMRPRLGGTVPLPPRGAASDLFLVTVDDLSSEERAAPGWCLRLGVPDAIPETEDFDMHELVAEITIAQGGTTYVIEANAFPGATLHLAGEQLSARVKWGTDPVSVPPASAVRWQLARGQCQTRAVRAFTVLAPTVGIVPPFATSFALFSGAADVVEDIQLDFAVHANSSRVIQHYTRRDLLQAFAAYNPLPPGASSWRWLTETGGPVRLVFNIGDQL